MDGPDEDGSSAGTWLGLLEMRASDSSVGRRDSLARSQAFQKRIECGASGRVVPFRYCRIWPMGLHFPSCSHRSALYKLCRHPQTHYL